MSDFLKGSIWIIVIIPAWILAYSVMFSLLGVILVLFVLVIEGIMIVKNFRKRKNYTYGLITSFLIIALSFMILPKIIDCGFNSGNIIKCLIK